jgi:PPM family protein phosphatase
LRPGFARGAGEDRLAERPVWAASHVGLVRRVNEDRILVGGWRSEGANVIWRGALPTHRGWVVIADGMGGHQAGDVAAQVAIETIARSIKHAHDERDIASMLEAANRDLYVAMNQHGGAPGMGTTIAGVIWSERCGLVFNLGDSRAYLIEPEGLLQISADHTLAAFGLPGRALTQSLGGTLCPTPLRPRIEYVNLAADIGLLLCTDGLSDLLDEGQIARILAGRTTNPAQQLTAAALDAGGHDNVTVVVVGPSAEATATTSRRHSWQLADSN